MGDTITERKVTFPTLLNTTSGNILPGSWKEGMLCKREKGIIKMGWKDRLVILLEGSLFYYQHPTDLTPKGVYHLKNCQVAEGNEKKSKRKYSFVLLVSESNVINEVYFAGADETDKIQWIEAITKNLNKAPSPPPDKEFIKKTKSAAMYVSGRVIDTIANMGAGGKIMKEFITDDTIAVIEAMKAFIIQFSNSEKANKLEKQAISISAKIALVYKEKHVTKEYFESLRVPVRVMISKIIDGYEIPFAFSVTELIDSIRAVQKAFEQIFRPFLPEKTMTKMAAIFDLFCGEELIEDFFTKRKWRECEIVGLTLRKLWDDGYF